MFPSPHLRAAQTALPPRLLMPTSVCCPPQPPLPAFSHTSMLTCYTGIDPPLSSAALLAELKQSKGRHALPPITVAADPAAAHGTIKLLRFHDNYRPAYYGTYSKTSAAVTGRHPLARDAVLFNYEYDSEDDWEEEEEGEDILSNDEDEQDAQGMWRRA